MTTKIDLPGPVPYQLPEAPFNGLAIIGEAPGADEAKQGKPFVGRSGQLLNDLLAEAGLERAHTLVANVFRYQPPGNKVAHFFLSQRAGAAAGEALDVRHGKMGSGYVRQIFAGELDTLAETLAKLQPRAILTLGGTALWALTGLSGLTKLRGQWQENRLLPGVPVMPTFHPSFILRGNLPERDLMLADIKTVQKKLG